MAGADTVSYPSVWREPGIDDLHIRAEVDTAAVVDAMEALDIGSAAARTTIEQRHTLPDHPAVKGPAGDTEYRRGRVTIGLNMGGLAQRHLYTLWLCGNQDKADRAISEQASAILAHELGHARDYETRRGRLFFEQARHNLRKPQFTGGIGAWALGSTVDAGLFYEMWRLVPRVELLQERPTLSSAFLGILAVGGLAKLTGNSLALRAVLGFVGRDLDHHLKSPSEQSANACEIAYLKELQAGTAPLLVRVTSKEPW